MIEYCKRCQVRISSDNAALCKKFFGSETVEMLCYDCLAKKCECSVDEVKAVEMNYRRIGCRMFSPLEI